MSVDVLIVGAGPAGMSAAIELQAVGARVRVVDEQVDAGGQAYRAIRRTTWANPQSIDFYGEGAGQALDLVNRFDHGEIEKSWATSVWDIGENGGVPYLGLVQEGRAELASARHVILATGAMERPTPFPGWTLPGVMSVGAAQTVLKESSLVPQGKVVIAGTGPLVYLFVNQLIAAGVELPLLLDTSSRQVPPRLWLELARGLAVDGKSVARGQAWLRAIRGAGVRRLCEVTAIRAGGSERVDSVEYVHDGTRQRVEADLLLVHDGVMPNSYLAMAAGCDHQWHEHQHYWAPVLLAGGLSSKPGISIAGDGAGISGADAAVCSGRIVAWNVAVRLGLTDLETLRNRLRREHRSWARNTVLRRFLDRHYRPSACLQAADDDATVVCRCEGVTAGEIREVASMGCTGPNQAKAFTRCGMGPCMGRMCGNTVSRLLAESMGMSVGDVGHYRIRPPLRPLTVSQLARLEIQNG